MGFVVTVAILWCLVPSKRLLELNFQTWALVRENPLQRLLLLLGERNKFIVFQPEFLRQTFLKDRDELTMTLSNLLLLSTSSACLFLIHDLLGLVSQELRELVLMVFQLKFFV